jgi:hypothetical protein
MELKEVNERMQNPSLALPGSGKWHVYEENRSIR